jgi:hypothetical protein
MSMAYHLEADRLTEMGNQTFEQFSGTFCNFGQDNWNEKLPTVELAYNNSVTLAPALSLVHANNGHHPRNNWETELEARNAWLLRYVI